LVGRSQGPQIAVEVGGQLQWNLVDSCSGTQWTVAVELGG